VQTVRKGLGRGHHAEAGADLIDGDQAHVHDLARSLKLKTTRILRDGWGFYGLDRRGGYRIRHGQDTFGAASRMLEAEIAEYVLAERRWDSAIASALAREPVSRWLERSGADPALGAGVRGLRGFFLADPEDLSLIALVDQFAASGPPGEDEVFRIKGGNDSLPRAMAADLRGKVRLGTVVRKIAQTDRGARITVEGRALAELDADYVVVALPASTLRFVEFHPRLPDEQSRAIGTLRYGCATRLLLQFARPFWRKPGRPRAFGSDLPTGAVWDGAEEQPGAAILSLLAGGLASRELQAIVADEGAPGVVARLHWLGTPSPLLKADTVVWENEEWSRGGYAYFDPSFDPKLRAWLGRPFGRLLFAGEHTSLRWQGYMNGAIETGRRAAAEVRALVRGGVTPLPVLPKTYAAESPEVWGS
jgi:monoamine oxidase